MLKVLKDRINSLKRMKINVFSFGWWLYVLSAVLFMIVLFRLRDRYDYETKRKIILVLSIVEFIILRIYKRSLKSVYDKYNYFNELPCYLCNISTMLCIIAALTDNSVLMGFCTTIGLFGSLLAIFMPDKYYIDKPLFSRQALGFYGYHCLLLVTCLGFYLLGLYKPDPKDALWAMVILFVVTCVIHIVNIVLRKTGLNPTCNYTFTIEPDNNVLEFFYKLFPVKLFYLLPVLFIMGLIAYLMLMIIK